jgi:hypothetical protein
MKKLIVHIVCANDGSYRVEKNINTIDPKVGSILSPKQLEELMTDTTLEVHIKDMKR